MSEQEKEFKPLQYEDRIVAFIDILGFSDLVQETDNDDGKLRKVLSALQIINMQERNDAFNVINRMMENTPLIKYACFSDSITVSIPCGTKENICATFSTLMCSITELGYDLATFGVFVRGGISVGKFLHTDTGIVVGPPLIEAYNLENKVAKNARIILSNKLISQMSNYNIDMDFLYYKNLERYEDGCVGFDQFLHADLRLKELSKQPLNQYTFELDSIESIRSHVVKGLDKYSELPDVYAKYKWLRERFNTVAVKCKGYVHPICDETHLRMAKCLSFREIDQKEGTARIIQ